MEQTCFIPTTWGDVQITSRDNKLSRLLLPISEQNPDQRDDPPVALATAISNYFSGLPVSFAVSFGDQQLDDTYFQSIAWWQTNTGIFPLQKSAYPATPIELDLVGLTPYLSRVLAATAAIPWGQTITYSDLGYLVSGNYRQARAVGTAMRLNPLPLIIPCHRVVAKNGPGGFSGGTGVDYKLKMLALEK